MRFIGKSTSSECYSDTFLITTCHQAMKWPEKEHRASDSALDWTLHDNVVGSLAATTKPARSCRHLLIGMQRSRTDRRQMSLSGTSCKPQEFLAPSFAPFSYMDKFLKFSLAATAH